MDYKHCYEAYAAELLDYYRRGLITVKCQTAKDDEDGTGNAPDFTGLEAVAEAIEVSVPFVV